MIERGELRLPEMQRRFVWQSTRVRDLLDSLYRGYPSGAILLWETDEPVPQQAFAVHQVDNPYKSARLLLDGQQRLTSLSAVLRGEPIRVRGRERPIDILFNLEHPDRPTLVTEVEEESDDDEIFGEADSSEDELLSRLQKMTFVVATSKLERLPQWVKVSEVFRSESDAPFLKRAGVSDFEDKRYEKYSQRLGRLRGIKKYSYRMDVLEPGMTYEEVTEIFVRVNSLGAKLRGSDLALAQITAKWRNSLKEFQTFQESCAANGFELDLGIHLKNLVAFATGQSRFLTIGRLTVAQLQDAWAECGTGLFFAINFLKANAGIESPALLSSPFLLVTLANLGQRCNFQISPSESAELRRWVLLANAKGRYSRGSSETLLDQDLSGLRQGEGVEGLLDRLRQQVGRLETDSGDLAGRNQRSAIFKAMFLAFKDAGARDWRSNLGISLDHAGSQHKLQFHHIFPKAVLKGHYSPREADDIGNLCFIGGKTNRQISDKEPADYFPSLLAGAGDAAFEAQCIPTAPDLLRVSAYKSFLDERRRLIATRLNEFLGTTDGG